MLTETDEKARLTHHNLALLNEDVFGVDAHRLTIFEMRSELSERSPIFAHLAVLRWWSCGLRLKQHHSTKIPSSFSRESIC
jgi:hypothetical protein